MGDRSIFMLAFDYVLKALYILRQFYSDVKRPTHGASYVELCTRCCHAILVSPYTPSFYGNSLRAFYTPSRNEVRAIEKELIAASAELAALGVEINRTKSLLQTLEDCYIRLNSPITRTRQFINPSPIRRLPSEVLCIIFLHYCHTPVPEDPMRYELPFTLAVVCSKWRSILLDSPFLWTVIHLGPMRCSPVIVDRQLALSGCLPLSLHIQGPLDGRPSTGVYEETDDYFKSVLSQIFKALPRWEEVYLEIPINQLEAFEVLLHGAIQPITPQGRNDVDDRTPLTPKLLEAVTLKVPDVSRLEAPCLPTIFESAPKFKSFCFCNEDDDMYTGQNFWPSRGIPWKQLETIILANPDLDVLDRLPAELFTDGKAIGLELYLQHPPAYRRFITPVVISKFTSLKLAPIHWNGELPYYIEALSTTTLEHVEVGCSMHENEVWRETPDGQNNIGYPNILDALLATIVNSKCALKSFTFYVFGDAPDKSFDDSFARAIIALLRVTPALESLEICEGIERGPSLFGDPEFFALCETGGLLPQLESLELVWAGDRKPPVGLIPMLQSRMGGSALKSVVLGVGNGDDLQPQVLDCLRQLRESGIRASV